MSHRKAIVWLVALLVAPALVHAQFQAEDWELTIGGTGSNDSDFSGSTASVNGSLGYFFTESLEVALRQSLGYSDVGGTDGSAWVGSTRVAGDYHFNMERWQPFIGANIGYVYGDGVNDTWEAAPEAGVKYFLNDTTFVMVMAEYQFFFDSGDDVGDNFEDGQFVYSLNLGVRL